MPRAPDVGSRAVIMEMLREADGGIVLRKDILARINCTEGTLKVHVHYLREMGFDIKSSYGSGGYYLLREAEGVDFTRSYTESSDVTDGRDWRPEQIHASEDPLLDALQAEHPERLGGKFSHYSDVRPAA